MTAVQTEAPRMRAGMPRLVALSTATIFLSAALLFFVQPLFAKMVLPKLGGTPAVWTTAMLFFQTCLLLGYVYAHLLIRHVRPLRQVAIHGAFWAAALVFLPLAVGDAPVPAGGATAGHALWIFAVGVGVPFTMLSANAPLIQSWYARTGGPSAADPYFLYGASNAGSLIALLAYPLVAEPLLGTATTSWAWSGGFILLGGLLLACGLAARRPAPASGRAAADTAGRDRPGAHTIAAWLFLAFVPSSLMLVVTTKISTDIGSFPLVWAIPLSIYILTFVLAFAARPLIPDRVVTALFVPALTGLLIACGHLVWPTPTATAVAVLAASFFAVALLAHRRLYLLRPDARHLTFFYVVVSTGGALASFFNLIVAPAFFDTLVEVPATLIAVAAILPLAGAATVPDRGRTAILLSLAALAVMMGVAIAVGLPPNVRGIAIAVCVLVALSALRGAPMAVPVFVTVLLLAEGAVLRSDSIFRDRSFFGLHVVRADAAGLRLYMNGTTIHGAQRADASGGRPVPLTYYFEGGPLARLVAAPTTGPDARVGIVGLGVGSMACHASPGQDWHFYEIDPLVVRIATDPQLFTFLRDCAPDAPIHLGDARAVLERQTIIHDTLILDAYSSDAVPVHLLTREALAIYLARTAPDGLIAFHVSNRYYDLAPPVARLARDAGLTALSRDWVPSPAQAATGATPVRVVAIPRGDVRREALLAEGWRPVEAGASRPWTDDHANLMGALISLAPGPAVER